MYVQDDKLFIIWPTTCWKYCIFNIDDMDAKMDIVARNRTLWHMRTNDALISKRNCALLIIYIHICPHSRKQFAIKQANGGDLDQNEWMPFIAVSICW